MEPQQTETGKTNGSPLNPPSPKPERRDSSKFLRWVVVVASIICVIGLIGLVVWVSHSLWSSHDGAGSRSTVDIILDVSGSPKSSQFEIQGEVRVEGTLVSNGTVLLVFEDEETSRFITSRRLPIKGDPPIFSSGELKAALNSGDLPRALKITARFMGNYDKDGKSIPLQQEAAILMREIPLFTPKDVIGLEILGVIVFILIGVLVILFILPLNERVASSLFIITYFITFCSLVTPIIFMFIVSRKVTFIEFMTTAPVGLVKGLTDKEPTPQWLVNIGGIVRKKTQSPPQGPRTETDMLPQGNINPPQLLEAEFMIEGGVVVPFYIVLLAFFGAGINMTRRVPQIQKNYEDHYLASTKMSVSSPSGSEQATSSTELKITPSDIRKDLIDNYMSILSSPFLAIAMYYLLRIMSDQIPKQVLVLMAFATGLISASVVSSITSFANKTLGDGKVPTGSQQ
jgi:hypothetical protein